MLKKFLLVIFSLVITQNVLMAQDRVIDGFYLSNLQKKIENNWLSSTKVENKSVVLVFNLEKTGKVSDVEILRSSGSNDFDKKAVLAVYKASPFLPYTSNSDNGFVKLQFFFSPTYTCVNVIKYDTLRVGGDSTFDQLIGNVEFGRYIYNLKKRVISNWDVESYPVDKTAMAFFDVDKDGSIRNLLLLKSSGDKSFDSDVLDAINKSVPFDILPKAWEKSSIKLQLSFAYHSLRNPRRGEIALNCSLANPDSDLIKDYQDYQKQVEKVLSCYLPQKRYYKDEYRKVVLKLTVDKTGKLVYIGVKQSSGDNKFNQLVLDSLSKSCFPPIPTSLNKTDISFEYCVEPVKSFISDGFAEDLVLFFSKKLEGYCIW